MPSSLANISVVDSYEEAVTRLYLEITQAEGDEEQVLDGIGSLQRQLSELDFFSRAIFSRETHVHSELDVLDTELVRSTSEQRVECVQRSELEIRLLGIRGAVDTDSNGKGMLETKINELINVKTTFAEMTEARDRRHLIKKRIEERLAKVKYDIAMVFSVKYAVSLRWIKTQTDQLTRHLTRSSPQANDDDDTALQVAREDHDDLENQFRVS